ncbi:MAG: HAMP domain-containing protein [Sideroxydans sp.]|nr:HAMP domain-containing protein [Sideroxydans sp.]
MKHFLFSMRGRMFLLLIAGITASAIFTLLLTRHHQAELIARDRAQRIAGQLAGLVQTLDAAPAQERWLILRTVRGLGIQRGMNGQPAMPEDGDAILLDALREQLGDNRNLYASPPEPCRGFTMPSPMQERRPLCQLVRFTLLDGTPLELVIHAPPPFPMRPLRPVWWGLLLFLACIAVLAWLIARMATRPLQRLADAADTLDLSNEAALLPEQGSSEVRSAARAFNRMQQRIHEDLRERTGMLAAITHDLQTPLTRLRLRLEKVQDAELRDKLVRDMNAMQQMLQEGLEFARSRDASEPLQRLDIGSLLASLCADASESGQPVTYGEHCTAEVMARPIALRRAITNLVDNAVKYGGNADVALSCNGRRCHIRIADNGPGIPAELLEFVFTPFYRVEHSRSRETGGSGLGLSIAHNIIEQHQGQLLLSNRSGGGLEAHIVLPLAADTRH